MNPTFFNFILSIKEHLENKKLSFQELFLCKYDHEQRNHVFDKNAPLFMHDLAYLPLRVPNALYAKKKLSRFLNDNFLFSKIFKMFSTSNNISGILNFRPHLFYLYKTKGVLAYIIIFIFLNYLLHSQNNFPRLTQHLFRGHWRKWGLPFQIEWSKRKSRSVSPTLHKPFQF